MASNNSDDKVATEIAQYRNDMREANEQLIEKLDAISERLNQLISGINLQANVQELLQRIERLETVLKAKGLFPGTGA
jgi:uncharacterized coiled-coil DUF342 family protein